MDIENNNNHFSRNLGTFFARKEFTELANALGHFCPPLAFLIFLEHIRRFLT